MFFNIKDVNFTAMYFHPYTKAECNRITFIFLPHVKLSGGVACSGLALGLNCADGDHASRVAKSCDVFSNVQVFKCFYELNNRQIGNRSEHHWV